MTRDLENALPLTGQPPTIVVLNRDLFFGVMIGNLLKAAGYEAMFAKTANELVDFLREAVVAPVLIVVDIGTNPNWDIIHTLTIDDRSGPPILAFGPHKDVDGLRSAKAAGVTRVVSNSEFHRNALELIQRYAAAPGARG